MCSRKGYMIGALLVVTDKPYARLIISRRAIREDKADIIMDVAAKNIDAAGKRSKPPALSHRAAAQAKK